MKKQFDFVGHLKQFALLSIALMVIGLAFNVVLGTRMDIAFKGGTQLRYSYEKAPDMDAVQKAAQDILGKDASAALDVVNDTDVVSVSLSGEITTDQHNKFTEKLEKDFKDSKLENFSSNTLSATMGIKFFLRCLLALGFAAAFLILYIGLRFKNIGGIPAGITAFIALLHDLLIVYFTFVVFRIELNENFVAVMLTVLGYSLNDTIVIFDRIRTNRRRSDAPLEDIVNLSLQQCRKRTIVTSVTTCVAILAVLVVALVMHVDSIISFALPMLFGSISGCYSSLFLSAPIWTRWMNRRQAAKA